MFVVYKTRNYMHVTRKRRKKNQIKTAINNTFKE